MLNVSPKVSRKKTGLDVRDQPKRHVSAKQGMAYALCLAFLVRYHNQPSPIVGQGHGTTGPLLEMLSGDLPSVYQGQRQPIRKCGAKLLHKIQCQSGPTWTNSVEIADLWVKPHAFRRGLAVCP